MELKAVILSVRITSFPIERIGCSDNRHFRLTIFSLQRNYRWIDLEIF